MIICLGIHENKRTTSEYCSELYYEWADSFEDVLKHPECYSGASASNWSGSDYVERTLKCRRYRKTGNETTLSKPFTVNGYDYDCGHKDSWHHTIVKLYEVEEIPKPRPSLNFTDDEIRHGIFHLTYSRFGEHKIEHDYIEENLKKNHIRFVTGESYDHSGYYFSGEGNPAGVRNFIKWGFTDNHLYVDQHADASIFCCVPQTGKTQLMNNSDWN